MKSILKQYWGYDDFRGIQADIIESISQGKDTLGLMPTGGGKSITFQVPALAMQGVCIVVTPLISLMKDQVSNLRSRGIQAAAIYSGLRREDIITTLENCIFGGCKLLYVSPERLSSEIFITKLRRMKVSFITVDEAHCISQWGYDFRPSYLAISDIRKLLPNAPVLALTATATPAVVDDIQDRLGFKEKNVFRMSFERKNLTYIVREANDKQDQLIHILQSVSGAAIVYTRSRKGTKEISDLLNDKGITATNYHAGLTNAEKDYRQQKWDSGEYRTMVATNAFGMGIDKPDVRIVIHWDVPDSIEAYFQEAGRAGRDGNRAYAVLLYNDSDRLKLARRIPDTFPQKDFIAQIYEHICYYYQLAMGDGFNVSHEFSLSIFCMNYKHFPTQTESALNLLTKAGYIDYIPEKENPSRVMILAGRDELYNLREISPKGEIILRSLLRCYGGMFSDYVFIEETLISHNSGESVETVYNELMSLSHRRLISYIPHKCTPYITFLQRRIEKEKIYLSRDVYDDRKKEYETRIKSMLDYARDNTVCRSRQLLRYFGEMNGNDCMHCDVCLQQHSSGIKRWEYNNIHNAISNILADGQPHFTDDFHFNGIDPEKIRTVLQFMINEEEIETNENGQIITNQP